MKNFRILAVAAATLASAVALAQSPVKETPPVPAPPRDFALPAPKQFTLDNGLRVTLVNYGNTPKVNVGLYVAPADISPAAAERAAGKWKHWSWNWSVNVRNAHSW